MKFSRSNYQEGYSLIELTVATGILCLGVAAAASLSMTSAKLDEMNEQKARAVAIHEAAARLWQLGLDGSTINELLLGDSCLSGGASFTTGIVLPNSTGATYTQVTELGEFKGATVGLFVTLDAGESTQSLNPIKAIRR